jgi:hypothetical protein
MTNHYKGYQTSILVGESNPLKKQVENHLNGKGFSNSVENFRGVSLCPLYSNKQKRKIHRIRKEKENIENRKSNKEVVYQ